jgi:hypothetical protein
LNCGIEFENYEKKFLKMGQQKIRLKTPMARTITCKTKRKAKERPKRHTTQRNQRRERASPFRGRKLFHSQCCNPGLGLVTKVRACKGAGQE